MNTGLPRHFTVIAWPTAIAFTFTSTVESASVSAAGLRLLMNGQATAIVPTAAIEPVAPPGMLLEAIACYVPRGVAMVMARNPLMFQGSVGRRPRPSRAVTACRTRPLPRRGLL